MNFRTMGEAISAIGAGQVTADALVRQALDKMTAHASLNAIAEAGADQALATARELDKQQAAGVPGGPLHGIPITVKDLFQVTGFDTRAGTRAQLPALGTSAAVARLQGAGAIIVAKANMHEIALGLTGENACTGDVRNPHDPERQSGGSSSGSAVAVAAGMGLASLGTDTGGSLRVPAALCGITAFKPTHGLVPLDGALPLSPTCGRAGRLATCNARSVTRCLTASSWQARRTISVAEILNRIAPDPVLGNLPLAGRHFARPDSRAAEIEFGLRLHFRDMTKHCFRVEPGVEGNSRPPVGNPRYMAGKLQFLLAEDHRAIDCGQFATLDQCPLG
ncbi:MAG: amidase [Sphingomicrobium sp.]